MRPAARPVERILQSWVTHAILVGLLGGVASLIFRASLDFARAMALESMAGIRFIPWPGELHLVHASPGAFSPWAVVLLPGLGGLLAGLLAHRLAPEALGPGTESGIQAFHNQKGRVRPIVALVKFVTSVFTIGMGGSAGVEGPAAQICGGLGSTMAQYLGLTPRKTRTLLVAGMAAGVGALFEAPLAAAVFAGEVLYSGSDIEGSVLLPAGLASIVSYSTYMHGVFLLTGSPHVGHLFGVPAWAYSGVHELIPYGILGLACGLFAKAFIRFFHRAEAASQANPMPRWLKPALGGLGVGLLACLNLGVDGSGLGTTLLGPGYRSAQLAFHGKLATSVLVQLLLLKALATTLTSATGGSGGIFAPVLVMGGLLGTAVGQVLDSVMPAYMHNIGAFGVVGMAATLGAATHAPFCCILMVVEVTGKLGLMVPSIWTATIAFLVVGSDTLFSRQVPTTDDSPAHQDEAHTNILSHIPCTACMQTEIVALSTEDPLPKLRRKILKLRHSKFPVLDDAGRFRGVLSLIRIRRALEESGPKALVKASELMDPGRSTYPPSTSLKDALRILHEHNWGLLCLAEPADPDRLVGVVTRRDILQAYDAEIARRAADARDTY